MKVDKLEIPIIGNFGEIKLCIYPALGSSMLFEEEDAVDYGESRWQLQEGCTYEYELVSDNGHTYQFMDEDEIVRFSHSPRHPNAGTLKTGIYVGSLSLAIRDTELDCEIAKVNIEIKSVKAEYRTDYRKMLEEPEKLISGLKVSLSLFENARGILAVEDNKPDCIELLKKLTKDETKIAKQLNIVMGRMISILDTKAPDDMKENFYHGLLLGLLRGSNPDWLIKSNRESGDGFSDIMI